MTKGFGQDPQSKLLKHQEETKKMFFYSPTEPYGASKEPYGTLRSPTQPYGALRNFKEPYGALRSPTEPSRSPTEP